jgi:tetratricopeptide (TPR) repeat protein
VRQTEGAEGESRFGLLETIREFGLEQLAASGEAEDVERTWAAHFLEMAEAAAPELIGPEQRPWLDRLETDHDNLRAALEWFLAHGAVEEGLRLAGALPSFWDSRGYIGEGRRWLDQALAAADRQAPPAVEAKARYGAGELAVAQRDFWQAMAFLDESRVLFQITGDEAGVTRAIRKQGTIFRLQDDAEQARLRFEEALVRSRTRGDALETALSLNGLGALAADQGDFGLAMPLFEEALSLLRGLGATTLTTMVLVNLGNTARHMGDHDRAMVLSAEALASARRVGDTFRVAVALFGLAELVAERGDARRAIALLQECLVVLHERKDWLGMAEPLTSLAKLAGAEWPPERTARLLAVVEVFREAGGLPVETAVGGQVGGLRTALGKTGDCAAREAGRALTLVEAVTEALALFDEVTGNAAGPTDDSQVPLPTITPSTE